MSVIDQYSYIEKMKSYHESAIPLSSERFRIFWLDVLVLNLAILLQSHGSHRRHLQTLFSLKKL